MFLPSVYSLFPVLFCSCFLICLLLLSNSSHLLIVCPALMCFTCVGNLPFLCISSVFSTFSLPFYLSAPLFQHISRFYPFIHVSGLLIFASAPLGFVYLSWLPGFGPYQRVNCELFFFPLMIIKYCTEAALPAAICLGAPLYCCGLLQILKKNANVS